MYVVVVGEGGRGGTHPIIPYRSLFGQRDCLVMAKNKARSTPTKRRNASLRSAAASASAHVGAAKANAKGKAKGKAKEGKPAASSLDACAGVLL